MVINEQRATTRGTSGDFADVPGSDPIVREAMKRFRRAAEWEASARTNFMEDYKLANADTFNGYQWPNDIRRNRDVDERPCLTINKVRQHNLQIINDAKQNKPSIVTRPTGNGATYESSQIFNDIFRHIEYISNAQVAYDTATLFQVEAGLGVLRVATDYAGPDTLDQEIFIRSVPDPLTVYFDPDAKEKDKSDGRFAFVFENVPKDEFDQRYPQYKGMGTQSTLNEGGDWLTKDHIRIAEYFRRVEREDKLIAVKDPETGQRRQTKGSKLHSDLLSAVLDDPMTKWRTISETVVEWFLIVGDTIVEEEEWLGSTIPLIPVIGEETVINGIMDRKGHTRALIDPQRMYNWFASQAVEFSALQTKTPWLAPALAIEGYETYWDNANRITSSTLPYNAYDDAGNPLPPPSRIAPPDTSPSYLQGMQTATMEFMMVSGQNEAYFGEKSNERSGKAIQQRERQGENATYHYIDNLAIAIRRVGKIILEIIPKVYDTERVMFIVAENNQSYEVQIDPKAKVAFEQQMNANSEVIKRIFNPNVGRYDVEADVGPAYATKREEAFNAYTLILTQAPQLAAIIGDLLFEAADFPMADEAKERLRRMVPAQALGTGPSQAEQQLQSQVQNLTQLLQKTMEQLSIDKLKLRGHDEARDVDAYNAETARLKVIGAGNIDQGQLRVTVAQLLHEMNSTQLDKLLQFNANGDTDTNTAASVTSPV